MERKVLRPDRCTGIGGEVVGRDGSELDFICPGERDEREPGGAYTFYTTPLFEEGNSQPVSCTVVE